MTVACRGVDDIEILVAAVETDSLNAAGEWKRRDVDPIQFCLGADDGLANAKEEFADIGIRGRQDLVKCDETFLKCLRLRSLPTERHHCIPPILSISSIALVCACRCRCR